MSVVFTFGASFSVDHPRRVDLNFSGHPYADVILIILPV